MKNLKSLIAPLLLALICTIGIGSMNSAYALTLYAGAPFYDSEGNQLTSEEASYWEYDELTFGYSTLVTLTKYTGPIVDGKIVGKVPAKLDSYTVQALYGTFSGLSELKEAPEIPSTVTNMTDAFNNCSGLTKAPTIPDNVTDLGGTFSGCSSLVNAPAIPSKVTNMGNTFKGCSNLIAAPTLPNNSSLNLTGTFNGCTRLSEAPQLPDGITKLYGTFFGCTSLAIAPTIPSTVIYLDGTFANCTSLLEPPAIPSGVKTMGDNTSGKLGTTQRTYTFGTANYKVGAFEGCTGLKYAPTIPNTVEIMYRTFAYCTSITDGENILPSSVRIIDHCFDYCQSLCGKVRIPDSVTSAEGLFCGCTTNTINVIYNSTNTVISDITFTSNINKITSDDWVDTDYNIMSEEEVSNWTLYRNALVYTGEIVDGKIIGKVPTIIEGEEITELNGTFENQTDLIKAPVLPDTVTSLKNTFKSCENMTTAPEIPDSVTSMSGTFMHCKSLEEAPEIPDGVTNMYATFWNCQQIETAPSIPDTVTSLSNTFGYCSNLTGDVVIPDSVNNLTNAFTQTSQPINVVYTANNTAVESTSFPDNVTLKLVSELPTTPGSGGSGTGLSPVVDGTVAGNMSIYGTVETIIMIDVTIPVNGLQFTINADRTITWEDIEITSNSPSPLVVAVISAGEAVLTADETGIYNIDGAPALVADDTFSDWNNLSKVETKANIAISVNGENICTASSDTPVEICLIESAYGEDAAGNYQANPKTADVVGSALYGKGWDNTGDLMFKYDTILEFSMP